MKKAILVAMVALATATPSFGAEYTFKKWNITTKVDDFDNTKRVYAKIQAIHPKSNKPNENFAFMIRCLKKELEVIVLSYLLSFDGTSFGVPVDVKVGNNDSVLGQNWGASSNKKAIFHPDPPKFVKSIVESEYKRVAIRVGIGGWGERVVMFQLDGIETAYKEASDACS